MGLVKLEGVSTIILDIEGTLCPIWFVARVLYPYATNNLEKVVKAQWDDEDFAPYKAAFPDDLQDSPEAVINHCMQLASKDIKDPAWKKLQGLIWRQGYADGVLSVPLYQDVAPVLKQWHEQEYTLVIFSSGSVEAQKLFFSYVDPDADLSSDVEESKGEPEVGEKRKVADRTVDEGEEALKRSKTGPDSTETTATKPGGVNTEDLNHLFVVNFDTINAGSKIIAPSYETIVKELGRSAEECLFLSDNVNEITAAKEAGLHALVVDRPGNAPLSDEDKAKHTVITSLEQIKFIT